MPEKKEVIETKGNYFIIIRETSTGRYSMRSYSNELEFENQRLKIKGLIIKTGISKDSAEKICKDYNDSHFPLPGLERWI